MKVSHHILVKEVKDHVCKAPVAPVSMDQQQFTEVFKSGDGEVTGHHGLKRGDSSIVRKHNSSHSVT